MTWVSEPLEDFLLACIRGKLKGEANGNLTDGTSLALKIGFNA
jgi:hypothetical protein